MRFVYIFSAAIVATTMVKVLYMGDNGLCTSQEIPAIHDMISQLEELDISGNELDDVDDAAVVLKKTASGINKLN